MEEITKELFSNYIEKVKKENTPDNLDQEENHIIKITSIEKGVMFIEVTDICIIPKAEEYGKHILEISVSRYNVESIKGKFKNTYPFINIKESIDISSVEYYHDHGISFFDNIHYIVEDIIDDDLYCYLSDSILESAKSYIKLSNNIVNKDMIKKELISGFLNDDIWNSTYNEKKHDVFTNMSLKTFYSKFNTFGTLYRESKIK
jgi:hypothetical protein|nr:MAG TPA: hypothetical protein [Caudoviricetes sp.]